MMLYKEDRNFYLPNIVVILSSFYLLVILNLLKLCRKVALFGGFSLKTALPIIILLLLLPGVAVLFRVIIKQLDIKPLKIPTKARTNLLVLGWFLYFLNLILFFAETWALDRFPMQEPLIVFFTLTDVGGDFDKSILIQVAAMVFFSFAVSLAGFLTVLRSEKKLGIYAVSLKIWRFGTKNFSLGTFYLFLGLLFFIYSFYIMYTGLMVSDYIAVINKYSRPAVNSEFYLKEYITPKYENIIFPEKKKNLIIILMESMESSYADAAGGGLMEKNFIPHLSNLAAENINFSPTEKLGGGADLPLTNWTIAAMLAKFGGLPFAMIGVENKTQPSFVPGALTLNDILAKNGYKQLYVFGSDKHFSGANALLETHGNVEIHDIYWYKEHKKLPPNYYVFWGMEDKKVYDFVKEELTNLAKEDKPFMLGFNTLDTHMPRGYLDKNCQDSEDMPLKSAIVCADKMIAEFLDWCNGESWYKDSVIVIMGDHLFMATEATNPFNSPDYLGGGDLQELHDQRRWLDIFIGAEPINQEFAVKEREFSSFDMFPTILAAIGCQIKGERLGFGVNLFSREKTLRERFSKDYLDEEISKKTTQFESLK